MTNELPLPIKGVFRGFSVDKVPSEFSDDMNNIRPVDSLEKRLRLGKRPGLKKWSTTQIGAAEQPVVSICIVSSII